MSDSVSDKRILRFHNSNNPQGIIAYVSCDFDHRSITVNMTFITRIGNIHVNEKSTFSVS